MLTLKIITHDSLDNHSTHIFYGERISHTEYETTKHIMGDIPSVVAIGFIEETTSEQPFITSMVRIFKPDSTVQDITIYPHADCFIMENGKTVDSFSVFFK